MEGYWKDRQVPHSLAELSESIFATLGVGGARDHLGLGSTAAARECLLLVDGLGRNAIVEYRDLIPNISAQSYHQTLTATFPSTTATSLTSLGTGLKAGRHGMVGYTMRIPYSGPPERTLNALKWDERVDPNIWQPHPTLFERASRENYIVSQIASKRYAETGFTRAALRGARYLPANSPSEMVEHAKTALARNGSFAYLYLNDVDEAAHGHGYGSDKFKDALAKVDNLVGALLRELPKGTRFFITSDHGMINRDDYEVIGLGNSLGDEIRLLAGEPRVRYLYTDVEHREQVKSRWQEYLGDRATVLYREEGIEAGLFGEIVDSKVLERIGDIIVIANGKFILVEPARQTQQLAMVGHHGGVTQDEVEIPLLLASL